jgi:hypothetical protein
MGWLFMSRHAMGGHETPKAYLDAQFTYARDRLDGGSDGLRILDSALVVGLTTYYAAAQVTRDGKGGEVFAVVCLIRWNPRNRNGEHFGYKDIDETMGPSEDDCPERILRLLTSSDNEYALQWRRRCLANLRLRARKLTEGMRIRLAAPLSFTDGHEGTDFTAVKHRRGIAFRPVDGSGLYHIRGVRTLAWEVLPRTRVHKTLFA